MMKVHAFARENFAKVWKLKNEKGEKLTCFYFNNMCFDNEMILFRIRKWSLIYQKYNFCACDCYFVI